MGSSGPAEHDLVVLDKESATGQFVRTAVCLSSITLKPLRIENIRQNASIQLTGRLIIGNIVSFEIRSPALCCLSPTLCLAHLAISLETCGQFASTDDY